MVAIVTAKIPSTAQYEGAGLVVFLIFFVNVKTQKHPNKTTSTCIDEIVEDNFDFHTSIKVPSIANVS